MAAKRIKLNDDIIERFRAISDARNENMKQSSINYERERGLWEEVFNMFPKLDLKNKNCKIDHITKELILPFVDNEIKDVIKKHGK